MIEVINGDCWEVLREMDPVDCIFADPPDNIDLKYDSHVDRLSSYDYRNKLREWLLMFLRRADSVWLSFNARHVATVGHIVHEWGLGGVLKEWTFVPGVQTFNFGNHNPNSLTNCHRPLWLFHKGQLDPSAAMVPSVRGKMGDKRAKNGGMKTPPDVFDYCRIQGNNKQRRPWHPTQLNEELVEQCLKLTTKEGDHVLDPFAGTGTTARVCQRINRRCTLIEDSPKYCDLIKKDLGL